jgi:hypothetical protein
MLYEEAVKKPRRYFLDAQTRLRGWGGRIRNSAFRI